MILPVLDLMNGQIVRGIAGRRDEYRPIVSKLVDSAEPLAVARAFREQFGFTELYLADLDAIQTGRAAIDVYRRLQEEGFRLWIDAGIHTSQDAVSEPLGSYADSIIIGLESINGPEELTKTVQRFGIERTVFSLDMNNDMPLYREGVWPYHLSWVFAEHVIKICGMRRLIVLDLAKVGSNTGVSSQCSWCNTLKRHWPDLQVTTGAGVRSIEDAKRLLKSGVDRVLVASALHDGRITPDDVKRL